MARRGSTAVGFGGAVSRTVDLAGPVHYLDYGGPDDGPLVVAVHGLGGSALNWSALAPHVTDRCRVVAIDLVGHGRTVSLGRSAGVGANTTLVRAFIESVADGPVVLAGNSMGGMIAAHVAADHPDLVAGVALVDPALPLAPARPDPVVAVAFAAYTVPGVGWGALKARHRVLPPETAVNQLLGLCCHDVRRVPAELVAEEVEQARARRSHGSVESDFLDAARSVISTVVRRRRYQARLRQVAAPVLLVHGTRDRLVPLAVAQATARAYPHWTYVELHDVGHVPQLEAAEDTAWAVLDWLGEIGLLAATPRPA